MNLGDCQKRFVSDLLVTIMTKHVNEQYTYWDFHTSFGSLLPLLSFPSCTIIDNAKVNEGFIRDSKKFVCLFCILVIVPKCYSSQGWTKVGDELDVYFCIYGDSFHNDCVLDGGTSYIFVFPDPS